MKKILIYLFITILFIPSVLNAQDKYTLLEPLPCIEGVGDCTTGKMQDSIDLSTYIEYIFKFSIALAGFLAIVMIILGGFEYMLADSFTKKGDAKNKIQNAIVGLLLVLASYLILRTIDPRLVEINTSIDPIKIDTSEVTAFQNSLANDIKDLSLQTQLAINDKQSKIDVKQQQLNAIKSRLDNEDELTAKEVEELEIQKRSLEMDIREYNVDKYKLISQEVGLVQFNKSLDILNNKNNYTETFLGSLKSSNMVTIKNASLSTDLKDNLQTAKDTIEENYSRYIEKIGDSDPEAIQLLNKQKEFYLDEIENQKKITQVTIAYMNANSLLDYTTHSEYRQMAVDYLNKNLEYYKQELAAPKKGSDIGLETEYKKLVSQRINMINEALNKK